MAKVHPEYRDGKIIGYRADCGKQANGNRLRTYCRTIKEAEAFIERHEKTKLGFEVILQNKLEFLRCQERCHEMGVSLSQAVEFFAKHGARKGNPKISSVVESFVDDKLENGFRVVYLDSIRKHLDKFAAFVGPDTEIQNVSSDDVSRFVSQRYAHVLPVTKLNVFRNLSVLFGYAVKKNFTGINVVAGLDRPRAQFKEPEVITPDDFSTILNRCLERRWHDRLAVFVLVGFCGVRTEEASKLTWAHLNLDQGTIRVPATVAKNHAYRGISIPPNALAWLRAIEDRRRRGPIIESNWRHLLRTVVKFAGVNHTQNCVRHSFCSYSIAAGKPEMEVAKAMGHATTKTIFRHYRNLVDAGDAARWWAIMPPVATRSPIVEALAGVAARTDSASIATASPSSCEQVDRDTGSPDPACT